MIDEVSKLLRHLFITQVPDLRVPGSAGVLPQQVRFEPPDSAFAALANGIVVSTGTTTIKAPVLNVYLVDLRENRKLRSNERIRSNGNGFAIDEPAPARMDCHFLITAWVPGDPAPNVEPTLDEQALLYEVLVALFQNAPLNSAQLSPPLAGLPALIDGVDLPTTVTPVDGFQKLGEFWGTMGNRARWLPAVYLILTVPVAYREEITGPLVTTKSTAFDLDNERETFIQIGGVVLDPAGAAVAGAWVRLETPLGVALGVTGSDENGRFSFDGLAAGTYEVRVRAPQPLGETTETLTVPSPAGGYEVQF
jgi:Pvc16 N-terminal domain/Carboxypeptidase regulatory-like domain